MYFLHSLMEDWKVSSLETFLEIYFMKLFHEWLRFEWFTLDLWSSFTGNFPVHAGPSVKMTHLGCFSVCCPCCFEDMINHERAEISAWTCVWLASTWSCSAVVLHPQINTVYCDTLKHNSTSFVNCLFHQWSVGRPAKIPTLSTSKERWIFI